MCHLLAVLKINISINNINANFIHIVLWFGNNMYSILLVEMFIASFSFINYLCILCLFFFVLYYSSIHVSHLKESEIFSNEKMRKRCITMIYNFLNY